VLSTAPALARASPLAPSITRLQRREDWEHLFAQVPTSHFTQSWTYGEGKRVESWKVERLAFHEGATPVAICQVLTRSVAGVTVVARINRGPLFLERTPSAETQLGVLRAIRNRWRFARRGLLFLAPSLSDGESSTALMRAAGFMSRRPHGWHSALIDLQQPLETLRSNVSPKWRRNLNAALKSELELRISIDRQDSEWMLDLHAKHMRSKGFIGPSVAFVRHMIETSPEDFRVFRASCDELPCSGLLVARYGTHAASFLSWTNDDGRRLNAHTFLMWHAFVEMKRLGCRALDLGGYSRTSKYGAYKRTMKGQEYQLAGEWLAI
jgi:lipid II:glycine glycyltransferase (peptidoglycan interpeptide bridge formation enzyme)